MGAELQSSDAQLVVAVALPRDLKTCQSPPIFRAAYASTKPRNSCSSFPHLEGYNEAWTAGRWPAGSCTETLMKRLPTCQCIHTRSRRLPVQRMRRRHTCIARRVERRSARCTVNRAIAIQHAGDMAQTLQRRCCPILTGVGLLLEYVGC